MLFENLEPFSKKAITTCKFLTSLYESCTKRGGEKFGAEKRGRNLQHGVYMSLSVGKWWPTGAQ